MSKEYLQTIEQLPYGLLYCSVGNISLSMTSMSPKHISLSLHVHTDKLLFGEDWLLKRTQKLDLTPDRIEDNEIFDISFEVYSLKNQGYSHWGPFAGKLVDLEKSVLQEYATFEIESEQYRQMFDFICKQYCHYIESKYEYNGHMLTQKILNLPQIEEDASVESYREWIHWNGRYERLVNLADKLVKMVNSEDSSREIAIALECDSLMEAYLDDRLADCVPKSIATNMNRIYIGNPFCPMLDPSKEMLEKLLMRAQEKDHKVTVVLSFLYEDILDFEKEYLDNIYKLTDRLDLYINVEINDWGWLEIIEENPKYRQRFSLSLGRLLNKRRKDARAEYKFGRDISNKICSCNATNDSRFAAMLKELGIERIEQETSGISIKTTYSDGFKDEDNKRIGWSLHLPLYQSNTAGICKYDYTAKSGRCNLIRHIRDCNKSCCEYVMLYKEYNNMFERYNSTFGLDNRLLDNSELLEEYPDSEIDCFVWNCFENFGEKP